MNRIYAIVILVILACLMYFRVQEGFANPVQANGTIPKPAQTSMIASDIAGSTVSDPTKSKVQPVDADATLESLKIFRTTVDASTATLDPATQTKIMELYDRYPILENQLQMAKTNPDASSMSLSEINALRKEVETFTRVLKNAPAPSVVATSPGKVSLQDLKHLVARIQDEHLRLASLRSNAPTIKARMDQLYALQVDVSNIITDVERKKIRLEDVGIDADSVTAFLKAIENKDSKLPSIMKYEGKTSTKMQPAPAPAEAPTEALIQLLQNSKHLKWKIDVEIEPTTFQKEVKFVQSMEKSQKKQEIHESFVGSVSPDVYIRPGFVMNDATIQNRGSASAFDDAAVGGLDYKTRVLEICRQIESAQLGDPQNFGCIRDPNTVGSSYSWKGNYQMVCNRLGDTWGAWYPEMFGCPKYDPTNKFKANMM